MIQIMISGQANFKPFFIIQIIVEIIISEQVVLLQKSKWQQLALKKMWGKRCWKQRFGFDKRLEKTYCTFELHVYAHTVFLLPGSKTQTMNAMPFDLN